MTRKALSLLLALFACACRSEPLSPDGPDGAATGPADLSVAAPADLAPVVLCAGSAPKASLRGQLVAPAAVTASELVMNCCQGVVLRWHIAALAGARVDVMMRGFGGAFPQGDIDLGRPPQGFEIALLPDGVPVPNATFAGTARVDFPRDPQTAIRGHLCAVVTAPGSPLDGLGLYASDFPIASFGWDARLTMHLLADRKITAQQALSQPLDKLVLASEPIVSLTSIAWYEASSHTVRWDTWSTTAALRNRVGPVGTQGVPFVLSAGGQRIYLGAFYTAISSQGFPGPTIVMEQLQDTGFTIQSAYPGSTTKDLRPDPRVLQVLREAGKLAP